MLENLLLVVMIAALVLGIIEHRKELREHERKVAHLTGIIAAMTDAEKVIKNCVIYGRLPLILKGSHIALIDCRIENLGRHYDGGALVEILGQTAPGVA